MKSNIFPHILVFKDGSIEANIPLERVTLVFSNDTGRASPGYHVPEGLGKVKDQDRS